MATTVTRSDIDALCSNVPAGMRPKIIRWLEDMFVTGQSAATNANGAAEGTRAIQDATVLTLSPNAAFNNERVVEAGPGIALFDTGDGLTIAMLFPITLNGGFACTFNLPSDVTLDLPATGRVPSSADGPFANDAAAAAAGVNVGEWYAVTGGSVAWRQV